MRNILTLLSVCSLIALFSCTTPSGDQVTKSFPLNGSYYDLYVSDGMIVTVTDEVDEIVITGDENVMEKLKVELKNGRLRIFRNDVSMVYLTTTEVLLPYDPALKKIEVRMDSEFHTNFPIDREEVKVTLDSRSKFWGYILADELEMKAEDHSEINASFDVSDNIDLRIKESSRAYLDGYTNTVRLEMSDKSIIERQWNGDYYAFMCEYCYGTMDGDCEAYIDCDGEFALELTNGSVLYFTSDPDLGGCFVDETSDIFDGN